MINSDHRDHRQSGSNLSEADAVWLRRGQRLGELLLVSRGSAHGWAAVLAAMGVSLIILALLGPPEAGVAPIITAVVHAPP